MNRRRTSHRELDFLGDRPKINLRKHGSFMIRKHITLYPLSNCTQFKKLLNDSTSTSGQPMTCLPVYILEMLPGKVIFF